MSGQVWQLELEIEVERYGPGRSIVVARSARERILRVHTLQVGEDAEVVDRCRDAGSLNDLRGPTLREGISQRNVLDREIGGVDEFCHPSRWGVSPIVYFGTSVMSPGFFQARNRSCAWPGGVVATHELVIDTIVVHAADRVVRRDREVEVLPAEGRGDRSVEVGNAASGDHAVVLRHIRILGDVIVLPASSVAQYIFSPVIGSTPAERDT